MLGHFAHSFIQQTIIKYLLNNCTLLGSGNREVNKKGS